jgi:hypothetical protein
MLGIKHRLRMPSSFAWFGGALRNSAGPGRTSLTPMALILQRLLAEPGPNARRVLIMHRGT